MDDEAIPYLTKFDTISDVAEDTKFTTDENEQSTLRRVHAVLKESIESLDKWHAFDCTETDLKIRQHIHAHKMAYSMVEPAYDAITAALATIDERYKRRNKK